MQFEGLRFNDYRDSQFWIYTVNMQPQTSIIDLFNKKIICYQSDGDEIHRYTTLET
jgi:hypothetical protein